MISSFEFALSPNKWNADRPAKPLYDQKYITMTNENPKHTLLKRKKCSISDSWM
jgi:hypothetical protein